MITFIINTDEPCNMLNSKDEDTNVVQCEPVEIPYPEQQKQNIENQEPGECRAKERQPLENGGIHQRAYIREEREHNRHGTRNLYDISQQGLHLSGYF
jgi:hypothetical protein